MINIWIRPILTVAMICSSTAQAVAQTAFNPERKIFSYPNFMREFDDRCFDGFFKRYGEGNNRGKTLLLKELDDDAYGVAVNSRRASENREERLNAVRNGYVNAYFPLRSNAIEIGRVLVREGDVSANAARRLVADLESIESDLESDRQAMLPIQKEYKEKIYKGKIPSPSHLLERRQYFESKAQIRCRIAYLKRHTGLSSEAEFQQDIDSALEVTRLAAQSGAPVEEYYNLLSHPKLQNWMIQRRYKDVLSYISETGTDVNGTVFSYGENRDLGVYAGEIYYLGLVGAPNLTKAYQAFNGCKWPVCRYNALIMSITGAGTQRDPENVGAIKMFGEYAPPGEENAPLYVAARNAYQYYATPEQRRRFEGTTSASSKKPDAVDIFIGVTAAVFIYCASSPGQCGGGSSAPSQPQKWENPLKDYWETMDTLDRIEATNW